MHDRTRSRWSHLVSILAVVGALSAACARTGDEQSSDAPEDSDAAKTSLTIAGPETGAEADGFTEAFAGFTAATGIAIDYTGSRDFETRIRVAAEGGDLPDIALIPQPGLVKDLANRITPVADQVLAAHRAEFNPYLWDLVTVGDDVLGIPNKVDVKSLVWYSPKTFAEYGYVIPETWAELLALQDRMKADGLAPWCVGIESGDATGWTLTDWFEDLMLRMHGPEVYDAWVGHEIPFDDPKVEAVAREVARIWFTPGNVLGGRQSIPSTAFQQAGLPVAEGRCGLHRQANFYGAQFKDAGKTIGVNGDVNAFSLPPMSERFGKVLLTGGTYAVAFNDDAATMQAMAFLAGPEYADARNDAGKGGFLSPNREHDTSRYVDDLDRTLADLLVASETVRFDGSDNMPSEVGAGTFWKEGTNWVLGTSDLDTFLGNVERSWPGS